MNSKALLITILLPLFAGCATPVTILKNVSTGQVARCGGDSSGFMTGGLIGHNIQRNNDDSCVRDYEKQGFEKVR